MSGEVGRLWEPEVKDPKDITADKEQVSQVVADMGDIVDAHIQQQGVMAIDGGDSQIFIFTDVTLRKLLEHAEANPERKAIVYIPKKRVTA